MLGTTDPSDGAFTPFSPSEIETLARSDIAYRYALVHGNAFAVLGADYSAFNQNGELDIFDPATGNGQLTNMYLADRAEMLANLLYANANDTNDSGSDVHYVDLAENISLNEPLVLPTSKKIVFGSHRGEVLEGTDPLISSDEVVDRLYGMGGSDSLHGFGGDDYLEGGEGQDILNGGAGDDILVGGTGEDIYVFGSGHGNDTIVETRETDGFKHGIIRYVNGTQTLTATGTFEKDPQQLETWRSADGLTLVKGTTWTLTTPGGVINLGEDFISGDFGIELADADGSETTPPQTDREILGDRAPIDGDPNTAGVQLQYDELGNVVTDPDQVVSRDDTLYDSVGNDHIMSGDGNDTVYIDRGGDDIVELGDGDDDLYTATGATGNLTVNGGAGRDYLGAGSGRDIVEGGAGADGLYGSGENDRIYGDSKGEAADFIAQGATEAGSGDQGEWVDAADGDDRIFTGAGNDLIAGGDGDDLIVSGGGNDYIQGDWDSWSPSAWRNWTVTESVTSDGQNESYFYNVADIYTESDAGVGNDTVYAGAGNDVVNGERGNDTLYLEAGDDKAWGGEGADIILGDDFLDGGDGNDQLMGAGGADILFGGDGDDLLFGDGDNIPAEQHGGDYLDGGAGYDQLVGGGGDDRMSGGEDDDLLWGGAGNDTLSGDGGNDQLAGDIGDDTLIGGAGSDVLFGQDGNDTLAGGADDDQMAGGLGNDALNGAGGNDIIYGGEGDDVLAGGDGDDLLFGGPGNDVVSGGDGRDVYVYERGDGRLGIIDEGSNTLSFGDGIAADDVSLGLGSLLIRTGIDGDEVHIENFNPDNPLGQVAVDRFEFADGSALAYEQLLERGFDIVGSDGNDVLTGTNLNDRINGGAGDDSLDGGAGDDTLHGGDGNDIYVFSRASGQVVVEDNAADAVSSLADRVRFVDGITPDELSLVAVGQDLHITVNGSAGSLVLKSWLQEDPADRIEWFDFDAAPSWDQAAISAAIGDGNSAPTIINPVNLGSMLEDGTLLITAAELLANASDSDGDSLAVVELAADSGTLSDNRDGTWTYRPDADMHGPVGFSYSVTDGAASVTTTAVLEIAPVNDAPAAGSPTDLGSMLEDGSLLITAAQLLANASDPDGDSLSVVNLAGNNGSVFDNGDGSWIFRPDANAYGPVNFSYQVSDGNESMSAAAVLEVYPVNDAPVVSTPLGDQFAEQGRVFTYRIPAGSFTDIDAGDSLHYSATLEDGSSLPTWLSFDAATGTFNGTPESGDVGSLNIRVIAADNEELKAADSFSLEIKEAPSIRHGNQGVGNGADPAPPGHETNFNDGPGTSPGDPGARKREGGDKDRANGLEQAASKDGQESGSVQNPGKTSAYLDVNQLDKYSREFEEEMGISQNGNEIFARWHAMNRALANDASRSDKDAWQHDNKGADIANLGKAAEGFLGSTRAFGADSFTLAGESGTNLQDFKGLKGGMKQLS